MSTTITLTLDDALEQFYAPLARQAGVTLPALLGALVGDAPVMQRARSRLEERSAAPADDEETCRELMEGVLAHARAVASGEKQPHPDARARLARTMRAIHESVARSGLPEMTLDEINAEIAAARRERRERERQVRA